MRKIRLPEFESFESAYDEENDVVSSIDYFNYSFLVQIDDEVDYLYGFISPTEYYDDSIVRTDDFKIGKRTRKNLERTYQKIIKQLCSRYKGWVGSLYDKGEKK